MAIKRKSILVISILLIISAFVIYIFNGLAKPGTKITETRLKSDLSKIGNVEVKVKNKYIGILGDLLKDKELKIINNQVEEESRYIEVSVQNKEEFSKPLEIRYGMRVWLYLINHELPYPISAVRILIDEKWVNDKQYSALILKEEFQRLYSEIGIVGQMNENEVVEKLTAAWVRNNNYERRDLK